MLTIQRTTDERSGVMPTKGKTKTPQHLIEKAVQRYMKGEQAVALAKEYRISKPGFYLWVARHKQELLEKSKTANMTPADAAVADKRTLLVELEALRLENRKLREKLIATMIKSGEI
jgi:hypothetical protein